MNEERSSLDQSADRWRQALSDLARRTTPRSDCPSGEQIWQAACSEGRVPATRQVIDHLAGCAHCGEAFRLAKQLRRQLGDASQAKPAPRRTLWLRSVLAAAAVVVALSVGFVALQRTTPPPGDTSALRQAGGGTIRSLLEEGSALPRAEFRLRWTSGSEGSLHSIVIADENLQVLASEGSLEQPEYLVPARALEALAPGASVLWRVTTYELDGSSASSATFVNRVE